MKRIYFSGLFIVLSLNFLQAQLLWKITGNGLENPSYIFGTHPLIPVVFLDSVQGLYKAFNECDIVVGEVVINNIEANELLLKAALIPDNKTIKDYLPEEKYKLVDTELKSVLKIGLKELSKMHPALILNLYEIELFKKLTGIYDDAQSDSYFQIAATEKGKKVTGFETIEQQINRTLNQQNIQHQADILAETVVKKDSLSRELLIFNQLYKKGETDDLLLLSKRSGNIAEEDTDNRNTGWLKELPGLMSKKSCFIAVDILHLPGDKGLINGLKQAGYKVKPVE
ncbi:MAG: TraB/GumN family protein [Bacteroidales bacterium]|nr:TraB/GumN family protein [Bacteroidales bacterium]